MDALCPPGVGVGGGVGGHREDPFSKTTKKKPQAAPQRELGDVTDFCLEDLWRLGKEGSLAETRHLVAAVGTDAAET